MNELMLRRRVLMTRKEEGTNGLLPTSACGVPNTVAYVDDGGLLYVTYLQAYKYVKPLFKRPISLRSGDMVTVQLRNTGTTSTQYFVDMLLGDVKIGNNILLDLRNGRTYTKTAMIAENTVANSFGWCVRTGNSNCNFIIEIQIYINGERVI